MDNFNQPYSQINSLKTFLKVSIILYILYLILFFTPFSKYFPNFILYTLYGITDIVFLIFIWTEMPSKRYDKVTDTILILLFGIFAILMWFPTEEELKILLKEKNRN